MFNNNRLVKAFTLIELLIVVAIIAILAAIAVPNFLEAQTRAKVSRVKADMRSMATGLETYVLDNNTYVYQNKLSRAVRMLNVNTETLERLTTPIAYLNGITSFKSPLRSKGYYNGRTLQNQHQYPPAQEELSQIYWYNARNEGNSRGDGAAIWGRGDPKPKWYFIQSAGPQGYAYATNAALSAMTDDSDAYKETSLSVIYDSTNGTVSSGGLFRVGGAPVSPGVPFYRAAEGQNH